MSANSLTKAIVTHLNLMGWEAWRQNNGGIYDPKIKKYRKNANHKKGVADVIGFHKDTGKFIAIEIKAGKDKLSIHQKIFLQTVSDSGGVAFVARNFKQYEKDLKNRIIKLGL